MYVFLCENQGCLEANTLKLNTYVKKEYQSCKHGKYAQQSEHYGERILDLLNFDCKPNKGVTNQRQLMLFYEILI